MRLVSEKDFIAHHGILGMKWGIRRFQNKDGSLTAAGKKRYGSDETPSKKTADSYEVSTSVTKRAFEQYGKELDDMEGASERFNNLGNELAEDYRSFYSKLKNNKQLKTELYNSLYKDFGVGIDDEELFEWDVDEKLQSLLPKYEPKSLKDKVKGFYAAGDEYFDTLEKIAEPFIKEYKDQGIDTVETKYRTSGDSIETFIKEALTSSNLQWNAYMYKHFDDYWVNDVDTRYELVDSFTFEDYNKWAEKQ